MNAAKHMRLRWRGVLGVIVASAVIAFFFDRLGRFELARPTLYSMSVLGIAIATKWKLRRHMWFWMTISAILAIHVVLVLLVPWTSKWLPAIMVVPFAVADLYAMLAVINFVGNFLSTRPFDGL